MNVSLKDVADAIKLTGEVCGTQFSDAAAKMIAMELKQYTPEAVFSALARCRREVKGRLSMMDIVERVEASDGRPAPEAAWGMCIDGLKNEAISFMQTGEMQRACMAAMPLVDAGDTVAARMAFVETYRQAVAEARANRTPASWSVSAGTDKLMLADVTKQAWDKGLISKERASLLLPNNADDHRHEIMTGQPMSLEDKTKARQNLLMLRNILAKGGA